MSYDAMGTVKMPVFKPRLYEAAVAPKQNAAAVTVLQDAAQAQPVSTEPVTPAAVQGAAAQIESWLKSSGRELEFRMDEGSGQMVVSVRDAASGELIRQIPGEAVLRMARALKESGPSLVNLTV